MEPIRPNAEARDLLVTAIEGYLHHDLGYDLEEAERAIGSSWLAEWTQEDIDRMRATEQRLIELRAALNQADIHLYGPTRDLSEELVATPHTPEVAASTTEVPHGVDEAEGGVVIHDELVTDHDGTDTALVIEEIGDEYQVYSQEMTRLPGGGQLPGKTGEVAQFATYTDAQAHLVEIRSELQTDPHRASDALTDEQIQAALETIRQQPTGPTGPDPG